MITTRFRGVVWTGGICAAALAFYMVSQTVAAKRAELAGVERTILSAHQDIRELQTEIDTRGGLAQIESWNARVYGLQAPGAEQFVNSAIKLVAMTQPQPQVPALPLDPAIVASHGAVSQVSLNVIEDRAMRGSPKTADATSPAPISAQPALRQATYVQARPSALAPSQPSPVREISDRRPSAPLKSAALSDDFLADLGDEGSPSRSRKAKP